MGRTTRLMLLVGLVTVTPVMAQSPGITLFGHAGGYSPLRDVSPGVSFATDGTIGGGFGIELGHGLALRTGADFTRTDGVKRIFYGADLQKSFGLTSSSALYVFGGAGGVTYDQASLAVSIPEFVAVDPIVPTETDQTRFTGRFGAGVSTALPARGFSLYAEAAGFWYEFKSVDLDRSQVDLAWRGGIKYRFGR